MALSRLRGEMVPNEEDLDVEAKIGGGDPPFNPIFFPLYAQGSNQRTGVAIVTGDDLFSSA